MVMRWAEKDRGFSKGKVGIGSKACEKMGNVDGLRKKPLLNWEQVCETSVGGMQGAKKKGVEVR